MLIIIDYYCRNPKLNVYKKTNITKERIKKMLSQNEKLSIDNKLNSNDPKSLYLLEEVSIFHKRILWYLEQQQKLELFTLGASGALWAYILKGDGVYYSFLVSLVPPIVTAVLYILKYCAKRK